MIELLIGVFVGLWIILYYIMKLSCEGKLNARYGWLAYSCRPILFFFGSGFLFIFVGTDWQSPFWGLIVGLVNILIGIGIGVRYLSKKKEIEEKFRTGKIDLRGD